MNRQAIGTCGLCTALIMVFLCSLMIGEVFVPPTQVITVISGGEAPLGFFVTELRLPRAWAAVVVGAGLGAAGAITQSMLRNPLASPDIIGVTAGAGLAAVALLATGSGLPVLLAAWSLPLAAALGGTLAGLAVVWLSWSGGIVVRRVVLVGLGINAGLGAVTSWLLVQADLPGLNSALTWLAGSLNAVQGPALTAVTILTGIGLFAAVMAGRPLALLRFDEHTARALGLRVPAARVALFVIAVLMASVTTALVGTVAFVAFVAPQLALALLRTEGPPPLGGALAGGIIMLAADLMATRAFPTALPVGLITSFVGVPFLLWILLRRSRV